MNLITSVSKTHLTILTALTLMSSMPASHAKNTDCWGEFFQESQYRGKSFRLQGPVQLANLRSTAGENWESRIESLVVGPKAKVTVFENNNFQMTLKAMEKYPELLQSLGLTEKDAMEDKELIFIAGSKIHDLSDFNYRNKIRSLKIDCEQ